MKNRFDLLIFDWDGTLFDSVDWIVECLQRAARDCGFPVPLPAAAKSVIGLSLAQAMATLYPGSDEAMARHLARSYQSHYGTRPAGPAGLFEGVPAMLETFRARGYRLAVATGKTRAGLGHVLAATGMDEVFDATRCADETASKPDPRMLHEIMAELKVGPERTLMIGDAVHDLHMARNAGVAAVGVGCGANDLGQLAALEPLACLERTLELLDLLD
jgi:phosphoglycolate phosphatase